MKKFLILFIFAVLFGGSAMAYDFSKVCSSGQTLYYNIISSTSVSVVSQNSSSPYYTTYPTGNLTIPSSVTYNGTTYSVTSIGEGAFAGCSGLRSVTIPNPVTNIGCVAFSGCSGLTTVNFNATNCTTIGEQNSPDVWYRCTSLTTLNIGNNVTNIPDHAFYDCESLTSVTIPNSVTSIGSGAFIFCSGLTSVAIGNSVTSIGERAFVGCSGLRSLTIGNSVNIIGENAFYECSGLTGSLTIPNSVTSIGNNAFYDCNGLASVTIGNSVTSIGTSAFSGCSGLTTVNFNATNCTTMGSNYYLNALYNCSSLATLTIGENVTNIPDYAFGGCYGLTTVNFNATNCTMVGESVWDTYGFTLNIGENVTYIPENAFGYRVIKVNYTGDVAGWCRIEFGGLDANPVFCAHNLYINNELVTDLTIPETISEIKAYAFVGDTCLTTVTIPNSVTSIGYGAFGGCSGLTGTLTIPNSVTSIGYGAFGGCSGLTSLTIGNSVNIIGEGAFYECSGLTGSLTIPNSVTSIGGSAFYECSGLTSLTIGNSVNIIGEGAFYECSGLTGSLTIPNSVTSIGSSAFIFCSGLTSVAIGNSVTSIGRDAFWGCSGLSGPLTIPNSVTIIGEGAFAYCSGLTTVTIGNGVTSIGQRAFSYCNSLYKVYSNAENPPSIESWTFESGLLFFVPCGAENNYLADEQWGRLNINSELPHSVTLNSNDEAMGTAVLLHQYCGSSTAVVEARPRYGYHFVHWNDGNTDNPRTINVTQDVTYTATFEVGDGIEENNMESKISLFPNPATDILNITSSETISEIEIVNVMGQVVKRIEVNSDNAVCDVEDLTSGVYVIRIHAAKSDTSTTLSVRRFVKK